MAINVVKPPYVTFKDIDGLSLDKAYIYIGEAGVSAEATPKTAYWDEGLTQVATQPIRTKNGFPDNGGSPGTIFVDGPYSITVKNRNQSIVQSTTDAINDPLGSPLIVLGMGASNMAINQNATGGNRDIPDGVFLWDSSQHAAATYTEGSEYGAATFGSAPLDLLDTSGVTYANSYLLQACIALRERTGRQVYGIICAMGGHGPLNYLTDATLTANGWTRAGGTEDMTLHYPNIVSAISAVPGDKTVADICLWYGTQGASSGQFPWQTQFDLVWDQAVTSGLISDAQTRIVVSSTASTRNAGTPDDTWSNVKKAIARVSADRANMTVIDSMGAVFPDGIHLDGNSTTDLGKEASSAGLGGGDTVTRAMVLTSVEHGAPEAMTVFDDWNGDNTLWRKYSDEGWLGVNMNVNTGVFKVEYYDAVGATTTEIFRVEKDGVASFITGSLLIDNGQRTHLGHDGSTNSPGSGNTTTGHTFTPGGNTFHSRDAGVVQTLNRNTSDGDMQRFNRDGVQVGAIQTNSVGILFDMGGGLTWTTGNGTPEGAVSGAVGSLYTRRDGGAATTLYVKETGAGNTGWVAK